MEGQESRGGCGKDGAQGPSQYEKGVWKEAQRGKEMSMKRDQKGFTIVELLIAVAILSIVIASVCGFILVGSRGYAAGNSDINVQQESQLALNQMSDVMIDTTRSVNYIGYDSGGNPETVLKDAEFSFTPEDKSLIMFNGMVEKDPGGGADTLKDGNGNKHYHFYWNKEKETLFYAEQDVVGTVVKSEDIIHAFPNVADADPDADPAASHWYVLARHVRDFSVDLSQVEEKRVVQLALTFLDGKKEYVTSNNVTIRNKVGVNDAELAPLNRRVELDITVKPSIVMEPGETFTLPAPTVTGKNVTDKSVEWRIASTVTEDVTKIPAWDQATQFTDADNGILHVSSQAEGSFDVEVTTKAEDSNHNKKSATLTVNIKRVKDITLWKSYDSNPDNGANEISPGCTFTISAKVTGDHLGEVCDACGEDVSIDKHIFSDKCTVKSPDEYIWRVWTPKMDGKENEEEFKNWHPENDVKLDAQDEYSATFHVEPNVPDGGTHGYVIQALSLLTCHRPSDSSTYAGRRYDWVWRSISLTVKKGKQDITLNPDLKWGQKADISTDNPDFNKGGQGYFLVRACIREENGQGQPKTMYFRTDGMAGILTPNMFGVEDITKPWLLSLQIIDPGGHFGGGVTIHSGQSIPKYPTDPLVQKVLADYELHHDAKGAYTGTYPHTEMLQTRIAPVKIYYNADGRQNVEGELELDPVHEIDGFVNRNFSISKVENAKEGNTFASDNIKFSVYKKKEDKWTRIGGYNEETRQIEGPKSFYNNMLQFDDAINNVKDAHIKFEGRYPELYNDAAGEYRLVPYIKYNMTKGDVEHIGAYVIYCADYDPNYGEQTPYPLEESTVYYNLIAGGNVDAFWSYDNNKFTKGEIYFPTPSEADFSSYFNREQTEWQDAKTTPGFTKLIVKGGSGTTTYQPSAMKCRYVADKSKKVYELELFYSYRDATWGRYMEVSAGVFRCAPDEKRWERKERGTLDSQLESGNMQPQVKSGPTADVDFVMGNNRCEGKMYIPLPSEKAFYSTDNGGFGFALQQSAEQSVSWKSLKYQQKDQQGTSDMQFSKIVCTYHAGTYTLRLYEQQYWPVNQEVIVATFTCESNGKQWTQQK